MYNLEDIQLDRSLFNRQYFEEKVSMVEKYLKGKDEPLEELLHQLTEELFNTPYKDEYARCLLLKASAIKHSGNFEEAHELVEKAYGYAVLEELSAKTFLKIHSSYTTNYLEKGDLTNALISAEKALKIAESLNDSDQIYLQYFRIGLVNLIAGNYEIGMKYLKNDATYLEKKDTFNRLHVTYNNIGVCLNRLGEYGAASDYLLHSLKLSRQNLDRGCEAATLDELGYMALHSERYEEAEEYLMASILRFERLGDYYGLVGSKIHLLKLNQLVNQEVKYLELENDLNSLFEKYDFLELKGDFYQIQSLWYEQKKDFKMAYEALKRSREFKRKFKSNEVKNDLGSFETRVATRVYEKFKAIGKIGRKISASVSKELIYKELSILIRDLVSFDAMGLALVVEEEFINFEFLQIYGKNFNAVKKRIDDENNLGAWCIRNKKPVIIHDLEKEISKYTVKHESVVSDDRRTNKSIIYMPLMIDQEVMGLITIQSRARYTYHEQDLELLEIIASYVAIALKNIRQQEYIRIQNEKLYVTATTDALTGVYNRHYFNETLEKYWDQAKAEGTPIGLAIFDLDEFKYINDTYGHVAGDLTLQEVGKCLNSFQSDNILLSRVGGEEFSIVFTNLTPTEMRNKTDEIRLAIRNLRIQMKKKTFQISASFGCGISYPKKDGQTTFDRLYFKVDKCLYKAKSKGKDCIVYCER